MSNPDSTQAIAELEPEQRQLLALMIGLSLLLTIAAAAMSGPLAGASAVVAAFLFVYAAAAIVSRLPDDWGGARARTWIGKHVSDLGAGFYGVMGLATFLLLEIATLREDLSGPTPIRSFVSELGLQWIIGFSIESFQNFVQALIWPVNLIGELGTRLAIAVAALCWGILWIATRVLPAECLACEDESEDDTEPKVDRVGT